MPVAKDAVPVKKCVETPLWRRQEMFKGEYAVQPGNTWYLVEAAKVMRDPIILHETCRMIPLDTKDPVQLRRRMASAYSRCFPCLRGVCHLRKGHVSMSCPDWNEVVVRIDARIDARSKKKIESRTGCPKSNALKKEGGM